ncbi:hypothetical protein NECAME_18696, partial [Necator americanus]
MFIHAKSGTFPLGFFDKIGNDTVHSQKEPRRGNFVFLRVGFKFPRTLMRTSPNMEFPRYQMHHRPFLYANNFYMFFFNLSNQSRLSQVTVAKVITTVNNFKELIKSILSL